MISLFFHSLVFLFSSLDLTKKYDITLYIMVINITKHNESMTCVTVTVTQSCDMVKHH